MVSKPVRPRDELDAREISISFSPKVQKAFGSLAASVRHSEHFGQEMYDMLEDWSQGKKATVYDVLVTLPLIAQDMAKHVKATNDRNAEEAWGDICIQMFENGFNLTSSSPKRGR